MQLTVDIEGPASVAETSELRAWLQGARLPTVERIAQEETPPEPGEQGPTLLAILTVILGSSAMVELVRSIHRYIQARTPKTKIKIKVGKKTIEIDCTNPPPLTRNLRSKRRPWQPTKMTYPRDLSYESETRVVLVGTSVCPRDPEKLPPHTFGEISSAWLVCLPTQI